MNPISIGDHGIIGNMCSAALINIRGDVDFFCFPEFDSPSVFASMLDEEKGGTFTIRPGSDTFQLKQLYLPETNVLLTRFLSDNGIAEVSDFMPVAEESGCHCIMRRITVLERTVEGELIPMAQEMGLGVTPWGPLKSGALSGKYTRENRGEMKSDRGDHVTGSLTDQAYDLLDELQKIANELDSRVAAVSLAWVHSRPGVTSTIIGARTMKQLDSNLAALDLPLSTDHMERLDKLSEPRLNFPAQYMKIAPNFSNAGATVNGIESTLLPQAPKDLEDHY